MQNTMLDSTISQLLQDNSSNDSQIASRLSSDFSDSYS